MDLDFFDWVEPKYTNITFLKWVVYLTIIVGLFIVAWHTGLLIPTLLLDKSYLCFVVLAFYVFAEGYTSKIHWTNGCDLANVNAIFDKLHIPPYKKSLIRAYNIKGDKEYIKHVLEHRISFIQHAMNILLTLGLIGTVAGIAITLWPFLHLAGTGVVLDVAKMTPLLGQVFASAGAALLPSVYSLIFCLFLMFNERLANVTKQKILLQIESM